MEEGFYQGKWLRFKFVLYDDWPLSVPRVTAVDKIWHPNINYVDNSDDALVYLTPLFLDHASLRKPIALKVIIEVIKYLLLNPDLENIVNPIAGDQYIHDLNKYIDKIHEVDLSYNEDLSSDEE